MTAEEKVKQLQMDLQIAYIHGSSAYSKAEVDTAISDSSGLLQIKDNMTSAEITSTLTTLLRIHKFFLGTTSFGYLIDLVVDVISCGITSDLSFSDSNVYPLNPELVGAVGRALDERFTNAGGYLFAKTSGSLRDKVFEGRAKKVWFIEMYNGDYRIVEDEVLECSGSYAFKCPKHHFDKFSQGLLNDVCCSGGWGGHKECCENINCNPVFFSYADAQKCLRKRVSLRYGERYGYRNGYSRN